MTISTTTNKIVYSGQTGQTVFAYNFRVDQKADMNVYLAGVIIDQGDWSIDGVGNDLGGNVTLTTPLAVDQTVTLLREVSETQEVDYQPFDAFPAETHEGALDKLTMITQQIQEEVDRGVQLPVDTDLDGYDIGTPVANMVIQYKADESGQESSGIDGSQFNQSVQDAADSAAESAASAVLASQWAENPEDDPVVEPDQYSAFHWAQKAEQFTDWASYLDGYLATNLHEAYTSDLDAIVLNSKYYIDSTAVTNEPAAFTGLGVIETDMTDAGTDQAVQLLTSMDVANNGASWIRNKEGGTWSDWKPFGAGGATISELPPDNPNVGDVWWPDDTGTAYIWYEDSDTGQWVEQVPYQPEALDTFNAYLKGYLNTGQHEQFTGDANDIINNSAYFVLLSGFTNSPAANGFGVLTTDIHHSTTGAAIQTCVVGASLGTGDPDDPQEIYQRVKANGAWGDWKLVVDGGAFPQRLAGYGDDGRAEIYTGDLNDIVVQSNYLVFAGTITDAPADFNGAGLGWVTTRVHSNYPSNGNRQQIMYGDQANEYKIWARYGSIAGAYGSAWKLLVDGGLAGTVVQVQNFSTGEYIPSSLFIPVDNTIPQITEGGLLFDLDFTPKYANSQLRVDVTVFATTNSGLRWTTIAAFQNGAADAIGSTSRYEETTNAGGVVTLTAFVVAGSTSTQNFQVRGGLSDGIAAALEVNGAAGTRYFGGAASSGITITEIAQ